MASAGEMGGFVAQTFNFVESRKEMQNYLIENHDFKMKSLEGVNHEDTKKLFVSHKLREAKENDSQVANALSGDLGGISSETRLLVNEASEVLRDIRENYVVIEAESYKNLYTQLYNQARKDVEEELAANDGHYRYTPSANYSGQIGGSPAFGSSGEDYSGWENRAGKLIERKENDE